MKLDSLTINSLKNIKERIINFESLTFIEGENRTGKTTILQAIELALTGKISHPLYPDKNLEILQFFNRSNSDTIRLDLKLKDCPAIDRIDRRFILVEKDGGLSVKQELTVYPVPENHKGVKQLQQYIDEQIGGIVSFDFRNFFGLSASKKFDYLFNLMSPGNVTAAELIEKIKGNSEFEDEKAGILETEISNIIDEKLSGLPLIRTAMAKASQLFSDVNSEVKNAKSTVRELAEIMEDEEKVGEELETLNSEHSRFQSEIESLKNSTGQLDDLRDEKTKKENRLTEIINELESANNDLQEQENIQLPTAQYNLPEAVEELAAMKELNQARIQEYREESNQLYQELNDAETANPRDREIELQVLKGIKDLSGQNCYVCGVGTFDSKKNRHAPLEFSKDFLARIAELEEGGTDQNDHKEKQERADYLRREILNLVSINDLIDQVIKKQNAIKEIDSRIERLEKEQIDAQKRIVEIDGKMAKIGDYQTYQEQLTGLKTLRDELFQKIQQKNQESGMLLAQKKAYNNYLKAKDRLDVIKYIQAQIGNVKSDIISKTFSRFAGQVNADFCLLNGNGEAFDLRFQDQRGNDNFQMGIIPENGKTVESFFNHFVDYEAVNTAHQIKVLLSFLFNLPVKGFRLYILDNMEVLSEKYRDAFIQGLLKLSDKYDNIVLASSHHLAPVNSSNEIAVEELN